MSEGVGLLLLPQKKLFFHVRSRFFFFSRIEGKKAVWLKNRRPKYVFEFQLKFACSIWKSKCGNVGTKIDIDAFCQWISLIVETYKNGHRSLIIQLKTTAQLESSAKFSRDVSAEEGKPESGRGGRGR